jgi:hypothetical protein
LPKCFCYLLHWVFDSEGHVRLATPEELNIQISLRQSTDDQVIDTTRRCCTTPHRTLGVHENPSGNYQIEYKHLVSKRSSGPVKDFLARARGQYGDGSQIVHTRFHEQPTTPDPRPVDTTRPNGTPRLQVSRKVQT